jgi:arginine utilization protein RocB
MDKEKLIVKAPVEKIKVETPVRIDKTLQWLDESRNAWKQKTQESKAKLKTTTLALKRAREDRDKHEEKFKKERCNIRKKLHQKDIEIATLKQQLEQAHKEVEDLKKKN